MAITLRSALLQPGLAHPWGAPLSIRAHACCRRWIGTAHPLKKPLAVLFPGQGSQYVGMAKKLYTEFPEAKRVLDQANQVLGFNLTDVMFDGPSETLTLTSRAQPAILATSYALLTLLKSRIGFDVAKEAKFILGHSLGEYTALLAAGSISFADAIRLVHLRGKCMQDCLPSTNRTSMVALIMRPNKLPLMAQILQEKQHNLKPGEVVDLANVNSSFQAVLSGTYEAVESTCRALQQAQAAARAVELPVSAPFHCRLMQPAADQLAPHLATIPFREPSTQVISNVTAQPIQSPAEIAGLLERQITATVQWHDSIAYCRDKGSVHDFVVFGPSQVLANLLKRDHPHDRIRIVDTSADIGPILASDH